MSASELQLKASKSQPLIDSAPCLIGRTNDIFPVPPKIACFHEREFPGLGTVSVDMVRVVIKVKDPFAVNAFMGDLGRCCIPLPNVDYRPSEKVGGMYRELVTFTAGAATDHDKASVTVGMGLRTSKGAPTTGFIEFNPNKCAGTDMLNAVLRVCRNHVTNAWVSRYDLAVDNPIPRTSVYLVPDKRTAETICGVSVTQYLGSRREKVNLVKVYDKAQEAGLPEGTPLTRCELTCDGIWSPEKVVKQWPMIITLTETEDVKPGTLVSQLAVAAIAMHQKGMDSLTIVKGIRDYRTRKRVFQTMDSGTHIQLTEEAALYAITETRAWVQKVCPGAVVIDAA